MKYLQRYLSLLFALVMCVGLFSVTAHADSVEGSKTVVQSGVKAVGENYYEVSAYITALYGNGSIERGTVTKEILLSEDGINLVSQFWISNVDNSALFGAGKEVEVKLENTYSTFLLQNPITNKMKYLYNREQNTQVYAEVWYTDGSYLYLNKNIDILYKAQGKYDIKASFTPSKEVNKVGFIVVSTYDNINEYIDYIEYNADEDLYYTNVTLNCGEYYDTDNAFSFTEKSEEASLLDGILGWIKNIFNSVKETAENVKNGFTNIINSLVELPAKLWEKISDGLKSLFVPSEESMTAYKDKWDELLASRLGAVYQVVNIITDSWDGVINADETDTIEFPEATLEFSGTEFTFGGYEVRIVPEGFGVLVTAIKSIVAIVCTVAFVNGLRKRYDEVMGVEQ